MKSNMVEIRCKIMQFTFKTLFFFMGLGFALIVFPLAVLGMQKFHKIFVLIFLYYSFAVWGLAIALMIIRKTRKHAFTSGLNIGACKCTWI